MSQDQAADKLGAATRPIVDDEMGLIACLTLPTVDLDEVQREVALDDFQCRKAKLVYETALKLRQEGCKPTEHELASAVMDLGDQECCRYLSVALQAMPAYLDHSWRFYARRVRATSRELRARRALTDAGHAMDSGQDPLKVLDVIRQELVGCAVTPKAVRLSEGLHERLDAYQAAKENGGLVGISFGFDCIDRVTGGLRRAEVYALAGRTGRGKSTLALSVAANVAAAGHRVVYFSLEMTPDLLRDRLIIAQAGIDGTRLCSGLIDSNEWTKATEACSKIEETLGPLWAVKEVEGLSGLAAQVRDLMPVGLVVVDDIHLIALSERGDNLTTQTARVSRGLKKLAMELDIPVLGICQFGRGLKEGDRPVASSIRDSSQLEHDAGTVLLIHHNDPHEKERPTLIVAKNRHGVECDINELRWHPTYASFSEATPTGSLSTHLSLA